MQSKEKESTEENRSEELLPPIKIGADIHIYTEKS
jgi:hypothetical protein